MVYMLMVTGTAVLLPPVSGLGEMAEAPKYTVVSLDMPGRARTGSSVCGSAVHTAADSVNVPDVLLDTSRVKESSAMLAALSTRKTKAPPMPDNGEVLGRLGDVRAKREYDQEESWPDVSSKDGRAGRRVSQVTSRLHTEPDVGTDSALQLPPPPPLPLPLACVVLPYTGSDPGRKPEASTDDVFTPALPDEVSSKLNGAAGACTQLNALLLLLALEDSTIA